VTIESLYKSVLNVAAPVSVTMDRRGKAKTRDSGYRAGQACKPIAHTSHYPIIVAAAEESRDELQDLWARLQAAADPARAKFFRNAFIDAAKKMDPGDATVLGRVGNGLIDNNAKGELARALNLSRDIVEVSSSNLAKLDLLAIVPAPEMTITPFGREYLRAVSD
jgi:hypothetical protein